MSDQTPWPLIAKYLAGECSEDENLAMEWWLEEIDNQILFQEVKAAWLKQSDLEINEKFNPENGIHILNSLINESEPTEEDFQDDDRKYIRIRSWLAAASIIFLIGLGYLILNRQSSQNQVLGISSVQKTSGKDQIVSFVLPDGSKVWLNQNSKMVFPAQFAEAQREVFLEGEAFFDVVPNPDKPFIVKSNKVLTKVLGTSFNVKAYKHDELATVSVATGKVEVSKEIKRGSPIRITQLTPRQELVIDTEKDETYMDIVSISGIGSWRKNQLVFHNNTYAQLIDRLEVNYGVKINLKSKNLGDCRVMASFNENTSLEKVLKLLSISNSFTYVIKGDQVTIQGGVCR